MNASGKNKRFINRQILFKCGSGAAASPDSRSLRSIDLPNVRTNPLINAVKMPHISPALLDFDENFPCLEKKSLFLDPLLFSVRSEAKVTRPISRNVRKAPQISAKKFQNQTVYVENAKLD